MSLTPIDTQVYGSPLTVHRSPRRPLLLLLALLVSCARGASRPEAPTGLLHYPAWIAAFGDQLLVVNLDQDLAYDNGALVSVDAATGEITGGVAVPNMAGQILVVDAAAAGGCAASLGEGFALPMALLAGRLENTLVQVPLATGALPEEAARIHLDPFSASVPFGVGFSCGSDHVPRAWVSYESIQQDTGFVAQVDLSAQRDSRGSVVQVAVGNGAARSFAFDASHDRLYFTGKELDLSAPLRWIDVGQGCLEFDGGVQDERKGGCHVDAGFDLGKQIRGAELNAIALSSAESPCTAGGFEGNCRRAYVSVRLYDADLASSIGHRPSADIGGRLVVLELPEGGLGRPEPQLVGQLDIGKIAGEVHVIPRPGKRDLVAVTALDDDVLWLYDDELAAMVKVVGRDARGVPALGHQPAAITSRDMGGGVVRLYVTSYEDDWVSAIDVPLDTPADAAVVPDPSDATRPWRLGVAR